MNVNIFNHFKSLYYVIYSVIKTINSEVINDLFMVDVDRHLCTLTPSDNCHLYPFAPSFYDFHPYLILTIPTPLFLYFTILKEKKNKTKNRDEDKNKITNKITAYVSITINVLSITNRHMSIPRAIEAHLARVY